MPLRALILTLGGLLAACGAPPAPKPPALPAARVIYVQIDGLTPARLDAYLSHPEARAEGRALHAWLRLGPGSDRPEPQAGFIVRGALAALPATGATTAATALTGKTPAEHRVWADGDVTALPSLAPLPTPDAPPPPLPARGTVALRFSGLAKALVADGLGGGHQALGAIDAALGAWLPALPADTVAVIVGGHGAAALAEVKPVPDAAFPGVLLRKDGQGIHPLGGLVVFESLTQQEVEVALEVTVFAELVRLDASGPLLWDRDLGGLRPLTRDDRPHDPKLLERLGTAAPAGHWIALVDRAFETGPTAAAAAPKVALGGPAAAESRVALAFAGPSLAGRAPPPDAWSLLDLAATLRGLQGLAPIGSGQDHSQALAAPAPGPVLGVARLVDGQLKIAVPLVAALGGPAALTAPSDPAHQARLEALARGARAARAGLWPRARAALEASEGLPPEADAWRALLRRFVAQRGDAEDPGEDDTKAPLPPPPAAGYPAALAAALDSDLPPVSLPDLTPEQRAILAALRGPAPAAQPGCLADITAPEAEPLARARALAARGLHGFAATHFATAAVLSGAEPAAAEARRQALAALDRPGAAWATRDVALSLNTHALGRLGQPGDAARQADAARAMDRLLHHLQRAQAADPGPAAADRRLGRLAPLALAVGRADPQLLAETLALSVGPDPRQATALLATVLVQGGLAQLITGDLQSKAAHLESLHRIIEQVLAPLQARPLGTLDPGERLAVALGMLVRAPLLALRSDLAGAFAALAAADDALTDAAVLSLRAAALAQPEAERSALERWAPAIALLARSGKTAGLALSGQAADARAVGQVAIATLKAWLEAEITDAGAQARLAAPTAQLVAVLEALVQAALAAPEGRGAALARAQAAAAALRFEEDPAATGPGAELGQWLGLIAVLARDGLFLAQLLGEGPPDPAPLAAATADLDRLAARWPTERGFARAGLLLGLALQRSLQDLPRLWATEGLSLAEAAAQLPRLMEALAGLRADIEAARPSAARASAITAGDLGAWLLDLFAAALDAGPRTLADEDALLALLEGHLRRHHEALQDRAGNPLRPVVALARAWLLLGADRPAEAARLMHQARGFVAGTALAGNAWLFDYHATRFALSAGDVALATAAADRAAGACPGLAWQTALLRAAVAPSAAEAAATLQAARAEAARRRAGTAKVNLTVQVIDEGDTVNATIHLGAAGLLLGGGSGSFELGAGIGDKKDEATGVTLQISEEGGPHAFAAESLTLEAWRHLLERDDAAADRALTALADLLWFGTDPGLLGTPPAPSAAGGARHVPLRDPLSLLWLTALAEARGHSVVAERLGQVLTARTESVDSGPYGHALPCEEPSADDEAERPLSAGARCAAPRLLIVGLGEPARAAWARWIHLRQRQRDGLAVKPAALQAALRAAARATPALPLKAPALTALTQKARAGDAAAIRALLAGPTRCGSLLALLEGGQLDAATARPIAIACGPVVTRFSTLEGLPADHPTATLVATARLIARMGRLGPQASAALWSVVGRWIREAPPAERGPRATALAEVAAEAGELDAAFDLEALAAAADIQQNQAFDPAELLRAALRHRRGSPASRRFVKALAFKPKTAPEEAARLLGLK